MNTKALIDQHAMTSKKAAAMPKHSIEYALAYNDSRNAYRNKLMADGMDYTQAASLANKAFPKL